MDKVLTERQRVTLRRALDGRLVVLCFGAGVDSTVRRMRREDSPRRTTPLAWEQINAGGPAWATAGSSPLAWE